MNFESGDYKVANQASAFSGNYATDFGTPITGGRLSVDTEVTWYGVPRVITAPESPDETWRMLDLDADTLGTLATSRLMQLLADLSPDISRALWDFVRMCNPGWTLKAYKRGAKGTEGQGEVGPAGGEPDLAAQEALDAFLQHLNDLYGSFDVVVNRLFISAFLRGAFFSELVLSAERDQPVDLATPDPSSARFQLFLDVIRGYIWQLGQWQIGHWVELDWPTITYTPIDPLPGVPYGRPLASPALFSTIFLVGLLHDLRRVVAQQGYPRLDLAVNVEKLLATMPPDLATEPATVKDWINGAVSEIQKMYATLQPDDAYIHTDVVEVNRPVGTVDAQAIGAVDGLIEALERLSMRALKSMPLLMGLAQSSNETQANREWEVYAAGIKSIQHPCEAMLSKQFRLALECQGIQAGVAFQFAELRAAELLRDAQVLALQTETAIAQYNAGWISQDEAAQTVVGHNADLPAPRSVIEDQPPMHIGGSVVNTNPEPGADRGTGKAAGGHRGMQGRGRPDFGPEHEKYVPEPPNSPQDTAGIMPDREFGSWRPVRPQNEVPDPAVAASQNVDIDPRRAHGLEAQLRRQHHGIAGRNGHGGHKRPA